MYNLMDLDKLNIPLEPHPAQEIEQAPTEPLFLPSSHYSLRDRVQGFSTIGLFVHFHALLFGNELLVSAHAHEFRIFERAK